jgi:hypothetical protein
MVMEVMAAGMELAMVMSRFNYSLSGDKTADTAIDISLAGSRPLRRLRGMIER